MRYTVDLQLQYDRGYVNIICGVPLLEILHILRGKNKKISHSQNSK